MRSRAPCSPPARPSSGCATGSAIIGGSEDVEALAASVADTGGVYLVPAFTGLGAPHWDPDARGTIVGLTRGTRPRALARATLESIAFQVADVLEAMAADAGERVDVLRVDGGAAANDLLLQLQADLLGVPVERPVVAETTALGAAYLAGARGRLLERTRRDRRELGARPPLRAVDVRGSPRPRCSTAGTGPSSARAAGSSPDRAPIRR